MTKKVVRRRGYVSERERFSQYVAQINAASAGWSGQAVPQDALPEGLLRREYAWRKADIVSEFVVPAAVASGYAVIGAGAGAFMSRIGGVDMLDSALLGAGIAGAGAFIMLTRNMLKSIWTIEEFGSEEIEDVPALPAAQSAPIRIELAQGRQLRVLELPAGIEHAQMSQIYTHCVLNGRRFSRRELKHILSHEQYSALMNYMLDAGLLQDAGSNSVELTAAGKAVLSHYE